MLRILRTDFFTHKHVVTSVDGVPHSKAWMVT